MSPVKQRAPDLATHVALLRGINVGGKNRVPMNGLAEVFVDAGALDVRTYIQSGNVVFRAGDAAGTAARVRERIAERWSLRVPLVLRTAAELRAVARASPFGDDETVHVVFLADPPAPERVARLDPARSPPDEFVVTGRDIWLRCPNGLARTKLTNAWFDTTLATTSTIRNLRTVRALAELASG